MLSEDGKILFISENIDKYIGYSQVRVWFNLMTQSAIDALILDGLGRVVNH